MTRTGPAPAATESSGGSRPWRLVLCAGSAAAALAFALLAWAPVLRDEPAHPRPDPADQGLCAAIGRVEERSERRDLGLLLGSYSTLDPSAAIWLRAEVRALDRAVRAHPAAARELAAGVSSAADAGARALVEGTPAGYRTAVIGREAAIARAVARCGDLAGRDPDDLSARTAGVAGR